MFEATRFESKKRLQLWSSEWPELVNQALQRKGFEHRIEHRTLEEQGIFRELQVHMGKVATAMERRGEMSDRGEQNRHMHNHQALDLGERFLQHHLAHARDVLEAHQQMEKQEQRMRSERERQQQMERHEPAPSPSQERERFRGFER